MNNEFVVVKFGSELVTNQNGVNQEAIDGYARGLNDSYGQYNLVVVTSGAVAAGCRREELNGRDASGYPIAVLAQLGATSVMHAWESAFDTIGVSAGGLFVTHHELDDSEEGRSFVQHLRGAGNHGIVSVINENDALSNTELMELACGGDNDGLARHTALSINADELILFTKRGGVIDDNGNLIAIIDDTNILGVRSMLKARQQSKPEKVKNGRGGMVSKLDAAWSAAQAGVHTKIAAANEDMTGANVTEFVLG